MKRISIIIAALLFASSAAADQKASLIGLGMSPELATQISKLTGTDSSGNTEIKAATSKEVQFLIGTTQEAAIGNDSLLFSVATSGAPIVGTNSTDAADSNELCLSGATGCVTNGTRSGYIRISGNEASDTGSIRLQSGNVATSVIDFYQPHASGHVGFGVGNPGEWRFVSSGGTTRLRSISGQAAGDLELSDTGGTVAIQEGTGASACSGTATANGTTAVTVSTTCATTGSRIFISATSDGTGAAANDQGACWATNIVNATSFDLDCPDANNNAAYNWIIFHEAP